MNFSTASEILPHIFSNFFIGRMARAFVEKIEVMKPEKVPGTRTKKAGHRNPLELHWGRKYPRSARKDGIAYIDVNYAALFLEIYNIPKPHAQRMRGLLI